MDWFGSPWPDPVDRAPVCQHEEMHVAVPVGALCALCPEPIKEHDRGVWIEQMHGSGVSEFRPLHLACLIHNVFPDAPVPDTEE